MKAAFGRVITLMLNKTFQIMIRFTDSVLMIRKSMFGNEDFVAMNLTIFNLMEPIRNGFWCLVKFFQLNYQKPYKECFENCDKNINCYKAYYYPRRHWVDQKYPACVMYPVGAKNCPGPWNSGLTKPAGTFVIKCRQKLCDPFAERDMCNENGHLKAFCAGAEQKWPNDEFYDRVYRCKQCPKDCSCKRK